MDKIGSLTEDLRATQPKISELEEQASSFDTARVQSLWKKTFELLQSQIFQSVIDELSGMSFRVGFTYAAQVLKVKQSDLSLDDSEFF